MSVTISPVGTPPNNKSAHFQVGIWGWAWYIVSATTPSLLSRIVWSVVSGSMPPGMDFDPVWVPEYGQIIGHPTTAGTHNFRIRAEDPVSGEFDEEDVEIIVEAYPAVATYITTTPKWTKVGDSRTSFQFFTGPLKRNGYYYNYGESNLSNIPAIWKSSQGGYGGPPLSPTIDESEVEDISSAGAPANYLSSSFRGPIYWDPYGADPNIIVFTWTNSSTGVLYFAEFDIDTETWSAEYGGGSGAPETENPPFGTIGPDVLVARLSDGRVFWFAGNTTINSTDAANGFKFWEWTPGSPGSWTQSSIFVDLTPGVGAPIAFILSCVTVGPADRMFISGYYPDGSPDTALFSVGLDSTGTVLYADHIVTYDSNVSQSNRIAVCNGKLFLGVHQNTTATPNPNNRCVVSCWVGDDLDSPTWTEKFVYNILDYPTLYLGSLEYLYPVVVGSGVWLLSNCYFEPADFTGGNCILYGKSSDGGDTWDFGMFWHPDQYPPPNVDDAYQQFYIGDGKGAPNPVGMSACPNGTEILCLSHGSVSTNDIFLARSSQISINLVGEGPAAFGAGVSVNFV